MYGGILSSLGSEFIDLVNEMINSIEYQIINDVDRDSAYYSKHKCTPNIQKISKLKYNYKATKHNFHRRINM